MSNMHLRLSGYGRMDTTQGKLSLHCRIDQTITAVICSLQSDAHSRRLRYAVRRPAFRGLMEQWLQPNSFAHQPESGSEV